jgi:hypothetical protein
VVDVDPKGLFVVDIVGRTESSVFACKYFYKEHDLLVNWYADFKIFDGVRL